HAAHARRPHGLPGGDASPVLQLGSGRRGPLLRRVLTEPRLRPADLAQRRRLPAPDRVPAPDHDVEEDPQADGPELPDLLARRGKGPAVQATPLQRSGVHLYRTALTTFPTPLVLVRKERGLRRTRS